jgi:hypothetical protein
MLYAGNNLDRAREIFQQAVKHRPRVKADDPAADARFGAVAMRLLDYFNEVAAENASLATSYPGDLRLAINAIMTLDGFFGSLHAELIQAGKITEPERDDDWKEIVAQQDNMYRVLRDTAYGLKHGNLTGKKPRLVRRSDHASHADVVLINASDTDYQAVEVINAVALIAREWLENVPR